MMCALCYPDDMCYETQEPVYIFLYCELELDSSTSLSVGALFIRSDHTTSPFLRIYYTMIYYTVGWGCVWRRIAIKVRGQSGSTVPRSLGSGVLVPCGHGQTSWLHRCGIGCHRLRCQGILLDCWCGRNSGTLFHLGCRCCRCNRCGLHAWCRCR